MVALFFWPVFTIIPSQATAPALVLVGVLMLQGVTRIDLADLANAVPVVLTLLITVLTANLINGMARRHAARSSCSRWPSGRAREVTGVVWGLGVVFLAVFLHDDGADVTALVLPRSGCSRR